MLETQTFSPGASGFPPVSSVVSPVGADEPCGGYRALEGWAGFSWEGEECGCGSVSLAGSSSSKPPPLLDAIPSMAVPGKGLRPAALTQGSGLLGVSTGP